MRRLFVLAGILLPALPAVDQPKYALVESRELPGGHKDSSMFSGLYAAHSGMVYIGSSIHGGAAQLYQYDPRTNRVRHIADIAEALGMAGRGIRIPGKIHTRFVEDRQGRIYFGTMCEDSGPTNIDPYSYEGPHWMRYDPQSNRLEDLV